MSISDILFPDSPNIIDYAGYVPGLSIITGLARVIYGLGKAVIEGLSAIFEKGTEHRDKAKIGLAHVKVGLIEMFPFGKPAVYFIATCLAGFCMMPRLG